MSLTTVLMLVIALLIIALVAWIGWNWLKTRRVAALAERLVPPSGKFAEIGGRRYHYVDKGEGPAILFIHGLGGNLHHFDIPLWASMDDSYRLIALDRAGSGYSTREPEARGNLTEQAAEIAAFLDYLGIEKALLVGHSLGGAVSLATALTQPQKVAGLALISPLTKYNANVGPEFAPMIIREPWKRRFISEVFAIPQAIKMTEQTLAFVFGPQQPPEDFAVGGAAMTGVRPSHFYATSTDLVAVGDDLPALQARYGEITVPVGILFGTADRVLDGTVQVDCLKEKLPGLDIELLEGIGHMAQYGEPEAVAAFIHKIARKAFSA